MSGLRVTALLAVLAGCSERPLPADRTTAPPGPGQGGQSGQGGQTGGGCGGGDPRLELIGTPLLALDTPPENGSLYTTLLWTGDQYLFVWRILDRAGDTDILMQRIDASGQGVGGNIRLRPYEDACDLAWGGGRLAAAWTHEAAGQRQLMFRTFDVLGRPLSDPVIVRTSARISFDGSVSYGPRIVALPVGFALAWSEEQVYLAIVDPDGKLLRGPVAAGGDDLADSPQISLAASADRILVGWTAGRLSQPGQPAPANAVAVHAFTIGLEPSAAAFTLDDQASPGAMQVLAMGVGFLALWSQGPVPAEAQVRLGLLDPGGTGVGFGALTPPVTGPFRDLTPAVWNADHLVVLWDGRPTNEPGLSLSRYTWDGVRQGEPIDLPTASPAGPLFVTAHDRTIGFIWSEAFNRSYQVYFQQARACP